MTTEWDSVANNTFFSVERCSANPLIYPALCESIGRNINGPSIIEVPDWLEQKLGRYYLYFGHHNGKFIRLAYANKLDGPWSVYKPGVLPLTDSLFQGHIASPDVHVDNENQRIRMYYHGSETETGGGTPQLTRVALSADGLSFTAQPEILGPSYMRVFQWQDQYYGFAMPGQLFRSRDGLTNFEKGPALFPDNLRHSAISVSGSKLDVFITRIGDCPESILYSEVSLSDDWHTWTATTPVKVLEPETDYEGVSAPHVPSKVGIATEPAFQLRDPALFHSGDKACLFYSMAGEQGIAMAYLHRLDPR